MVGLERFGCGWSDLVGLAFRAPFGGLESGALGSAGGGASAGLISVGSLSPGRMIRVLPEGMITTSGRGPSTNGGGRGFLEKSVLGNCLSLGDISDSLG